MLEVLSLKLTLSRHELRLRSSKAEGFVDRVNHLGEEMVREGFALWFVLVRVRLLDDGASFRHARSAKSPRVRDSSSDCGGVNPWLVIFTCLVLQRRWGLRMAKNRR